MAAAANANKMRLEIIGATGLYETGRVKKQDPYVEVHVADNIVRKTRTDKRAGTDPTWDEELDFDMPAAASSIKFVIKDHNLLVRDDVIGISTLDLARASGTGVETLPVFSKNGEPAGQLKIRLISGHHHHHRGTGAGVGAAAAGAGAGTGLAGAAARHEERKEERREGQTVPGAGVGGAHHAHGAERRAERELERERMPGSGPNRGLHEGQAAGVGAGLGAAAAAGHHHHHTGAHGTATTGLETDMANKARIGTGPTTGAHTGVAAAGTGTGVAGAMERGAENRAERREERREDREMAREAGAMGAGVGTGVGAGVGARRGAEGFTGEMTNLAGQGGTVCDQKFFTVEEDRPIVKEVKQYVREHHPVEREMVHETKTTGRERHMGAGASELVDTNERIVDRTIPKPCP